MWYNVPLVHLVGIETKNKGLTGWKSHCFRYQASATNAATDDVSMPNGLERPWAAFGQSYQMCASKTDQKLTACKNWKEIKMIYKCIPSKCDCLRNFKINLYKTCKLKAGQGEDMGEIIECARRHVLVAGTVDGQKNAVKNESHSRASTLSCFQQKITKW